MFLHIALWTFFLMWLLSLFRIWCSITKSGRPPVDYLSYRRAARAIARGQSPYFTRDETHRVWRSWHEREITVPAAIARNDDKARPDAGRQDKVRPCPYIYAPTLALWMKRGHVTSIAFGALGALSILGFTVLWLRATKQHPAWLLLIPFSDVNISFLSGNVELMLLGALLLVAWMLWRYPGCIAVALACALLIAFCLLAKPFYALFFITLGVFQLMDCLPLHLGTSEPSESQDLQSGKFRVAAKMWTTVLVAVMAIAGVEAWSWGEALRGETLYYFRHALEYQWFVLPLSDQTPFSVWNRTPMQALVNAGIDAPVAQFVSLAIWLLALGVTLGCAWKRRLNFPLAFAVALVSLHIGRPVCWSFPYLDLVVLTATWPFLSRPCKVVGVVLTLAWLETHWWALTTTAHGLSHATVTLQSAAFPWETYCLLVSSWLLVLWAVLRSPVKFEPVPAVFENKP